MTAAALSQASAAATRPPVGGLAKEVIALAQDDAAPAGSTSRREFLDYLVGGSALAGIVAVGTSLARYVIPPAESSSSESGPVEVASIAEIPPGTGKVVPAKNTSVIVINQGDTFIALSAVCPHANCVVEFDSSKKQLVCPCHGGAFDLNGNVLAGPPPKPLAAYAAEVRGDKIVVAGV